MTRIGTQESTVATTGTTTGAATAVVRVYALRRLAAVVALAVALAAVTAALVLPVQAADAQSSNTVTVTVEQDDNLWNIAKEHSHGQRTDVVVEEIMELNGLDGSAIRPGQTLEVPAR